jgi:hypothetical protein
MDLGAVLVVLAIAAAYAALVARVLVLVRRMRVRALRVLWEVGIKEMTVRDVRPARRGTRPGSARGITGTDFAVPGPIMGLSRAW